jgi:hypothetical protein
VVVYLNGLLLRASWGFFICLYPFAVPPPPKGQRPTNLKAFRINLSWCVSGQLWHMQEVNDLVAILVDGEEVVLRSLRALEATQRCVYHCDLSIGENPIPLLNARVFLSPQKVI